jgi:Ca-activated chloride channel family protein
MTQPIVELIPLRAAVATDRATTLDVLVRILPPVLVAEVKRPPLNLGLVIDRSGSMGGAKISFARKAARFAVEQLLPTDRVSITVFDDKVQTLVASTLAAQKSPIQAAIDTIQPGGSTALHEGWRQGGMQVSEHKQADTLNRLIILSDGQANVGETNPDTIATDVHKLAKFGVTTSTMGVGDDYNEDLMEAMAKSGDGNYYYIESPDQLQAFFQTELQGLMATLGARVSLGFQEQNEVRVEDVLNDFDKTDTQRYKLPNLVAGCPVEVVVRLKVPALAKECDLIVLRLAWNDPTKPERQVLTATLRLPAVSHAQLDEFPAHPEVQRHVAVLMASRARQEVVRHIDRNDMAAARSSLQAMGNVLSAAPAAPSMVAQQHMLEQLTADIDEGSLDKARKRATSQNYNARNSKPTP